MSLEQQNNGSDVLTTQSGSVPPPDPPTRQNRQFKHFIVTVDDERFHLNRKRVKRNRVRVACSECSSRKVKCSGCRPICKGCQKSRAQCVYRDEEEALSQPIQDNEESIQGLSGGDNNDTVAIESLATSDQTPIPSTPAAPSLDYFASLNEYFESFSNGSMAISQSISSSPNIVAMSPSNIFQSQAAIPRLGSLDNREPTKIRIPYFRWFGPTGIVPGFTKVLVDLRQAGSEKSASTTSSQTDHMDSPAARSQMNSEVRPAEPEEQSEGSLFNHEDKMVPNTQVLEHLLGIFFDFFGSHFPFYQRDQFLESVRSKSVPAVLLNSMCALASRYSHHPDIRREPVYMCGEIFGDKAKQLIVVLLAVPSYDLVASLLMLSWYEFGCNRDVGFWMYTGMAIRMAQDLGMHKGDDGSRSGKATPPEGDFPGGIERSQEGGDCWKDEESSMQLNLFWSIYFIDRIISLGTGRPLALKDDEISCPLPPDGSTELDKTIAPSPFPHMIRIMTIQGKANEEISTIRKPEDLTDTKRNTLFTLQDQIIQIYTSLDPRLAFKASNFRNYVASGLGGSFLLLHVWFHAVIITLHRPGLMFGKDTLAHKLGKESLEVSMSSANTITAILGAAELIDDKIITGTPFINQAIYIAGLAFIAESEMHGQHLTAPPEGQIHESIQNSGLGAQNFAVEHAETFTVPASISTGTSSQFSDMNPSPPNLSSTFPQTFTPPSISSAPALRIQNTASTSLLQSATKRNYQVCLNTITTLKASWRGIGWILGTMEQKAKGIVLTDPSEESVDPASKIDLRDAGMLQRLLAVNKSRGRRRRGHGIPSAAVLHPITVSGRAGMEMGDWDLGAYGLPQNGFGIGDGWVDLAWVDAVPAAAAGSGFTSARQGNGRWDLQNRVWALE